MRILPLLASAAAACAQMIPLEPASMKIAEVTAERATWKGRAAVRISDNSSEKLGDGTRFAVVSGTEFQDGVIEADLAGDTKPGAAPLARGFTGIAFRVSPDNAKYECIYLRPKNGRSQDQEQRNHSVQYISFPQFPWQKLRTETPSRYEAYVDLVPGEWTKVKIEVQGVRARLYVNGAEQPTLMVNDLKLGVSKGTIALWIGIGTVAHFSNLRVTKQ